MLCDKSSEVPLSVYSCPSFSLASQDVIKTTVYLQDIRDFATFNKIYSEHFNSGAPARAAFEVARLPKDGLVEIEAVAVVGAPQAGSVLVL